MQNSDSLIRTKLRQPFTRQGLVSRPRLQEQITQGLRGPLTLITAPAGFGKTTLVASCVTGCGVPVAWLSLDQDDNRTGRFLTYLVAALQTADQRIGSEAAQLMVGMQPAPPEAVVTSLINDLDGASPEMVLVLDDYQLVSSPAVHEEVAFFLEHMPNNFHLVIATRSDPPLPLARLRARGQMVELRAADLRFTVPEATQFLNDIMGLRLDAPSVAALEERTEGWIAGLQMAALSVRDRKDRAGFIQSFSGTNRYILDYLLEEVLASQPPEIQRFLRCTSILDRLAAPLCDALLAVDEGLAQGDEEVAAHLTAPVEKQSIPILEYLERENLFLVPLDDERTWFRYHHLFADLLKVRLQQAQPDLVPLLHLRAAAWLEENGFIPEAIQHLFAAHAPDRAADLIERYGSARWVESDLSVIQMADNLPPGMLLSRPKIGISQAWLYINQGIIEKALPLLRELARQLAGADPGSEESWIYTIVRLALAFLGGLKYTAGTDVLAETQVLDAVPVDEPVLRDAAEILYGMALARRGELDRAAEVSVKFIQRQKLSHGTQAIPKGVQAVPSLVPFLATIYLFQGRLHAAASLCHEFLDPLKKAGIRISTSGNLDVVLGNTLYEWYFLDEAESCLRAALQANEPWRNIMTDAFGLLALGEVLRAKGDIAGAMQVVDKFENRLQSPSRPHEFNQPFYTQRARLQLAGGDLESVSRWADQILLSEDYHLHPEYYQLVLARIRLAQGRYTEVEELLSAASSPDLSGNQIARQLEINLLIAAAIAGQGRLQEALRLIDSCLALAEPEGYIRVFVDAGEAGRMLLAAYLKSDAPVHKLYAQKVLEAISPSKGAVSAGHQPNALVEALSPRELEVLRLIAQGKTNQEIARHFVVARGTVKAQAASIYRKLDAANRTEAVARARQLGILP